MRPQASNTANRPNHRVCLASGFARLQTPSSRRGSPLPKQGRQGRSPKGLTSTPARDGNRREGPDRAEQQVIALHRPHRCRACAAHILKAAGGESGGEAVIRVNQRPRQARAIQRSIPGPRRSATTARVPNVQQLRLNSPLLRQASALRGRSDHGTSQRSTAPTPSTCCSSQQATHPARRPTPSGACW